MKAERCVRAVRAVCVLAWLAGAGACFRTDVYAVTAPSAFDGGDVALADLAIPDVAAPDISPPDLAPPDLAPDFAPPDLGLPDVAPPDLAPDLSYPDVARPDLAPTPDVFVCPTPVLAAGNTTMTLQMGTTKRSYVLHIPSAYHGTTPAPLILDFHGIGSSGSAEADSSPYPAVTDPEGVVMAFPDGVGGPAGTAWNVGHCCVTGVDDVAFSKAVVESVQRIACIDPARVYAVGVLTGGGMVYKLACDAADVFAAVSPAAFDLLKEDVDACKPSRPITEISFRGNGPSRVPYAGGASTAVPGMPITFLGALATFQTWAGLDHCTGTASPEDSHGCSSYAGCANGVEVTLCTKQGGLEDPGDATVAWPVLKRHTL
jgi:polyhydroxybutyrate depolymerase